MAATSGRRYFDGKSVNTLSDKRSTEKLTGNINSLLSSDALHMAPVILVNTGLGKSVPSVMRQAITWKGVDLLLIGLPGTNFSEI